VRELGLGHGECIFCTIKPGIRGGGKVENLNLRVPGPQLRLPRPAFVIISSWCCSRARSSIASLLAGRTLLTNGNPALPEPNCPASEQTPTNACLATMAEPPPLPPTDLDSPDEHAVTPLDGPGGLPCPASAPLNDVVDEGLASSSANRVQDDGSGVFAPLSLPVRQAFKQPVAQPKIHDITSKFTKACEGASASLFDVAGFRCSE
jgi:hypothetical protein